MNMYPFLFPFLTLERWMGYCRHCLGWAEEECSVAQIHLSCNRIPLIRGNEIAFYLGVSKELIDELAVYPQTYYRQFSVRKKTGGERLITAPRVFLKTIQRYILDCILTPVQVHDAAVGFVRGRSPRHGALQHVERQFLWNIDLKDFFPSINKSQVENMFASLGYPSAAVQVLSGLCCLDGILPQGAPTSPAIANVVFRECDMKIAAICAAQNIVYTRYADDLSFSCCTPVSPEFRSGVEALVENSGFKLNRGKTRLMGPKCRREVTGLTVNEKVSVPRKKRREIRALFHKLGNGPLTPEQMQHVRGKATWISMYHPEEGQRYLAQLSRLGIVDKTPSQSEKAMIIEE